MTNYPNFDFGLLGEASQIEQQTEEPPERKKSRFASLDEENLDELFDGAQAKSTKYSTKFAVNAYKGK